MSSDEAELGKAIVGRLTNFTDDLRSQGIHVGIGSSLHRARCVTCGEEWPCAESDGSRRDLQRAGDVGVSDGLVDEGDRER